MGNVLGSIVNAVLVHGLVAFEHVWPMPERLGIPLPVADQPRARGGDPIVLVGGFANSMSGWDEWRRSLEADGFQVFVFDPPTTGLGDMDESARAVAAFIEQVRRRTGRAKVDVIGFSEGGILARMAVARYGALGGVDRLIGLATPHHGVRMNGLYDLVSGWRLIRQALPISASQLLAGSDLLTRANRDDAALRRGSDARAPRYASIFSRISDTVVTPMSGWLDGAFNIPVQSDSSRRLGPNHFQMYHTSDRAYEAARILLLDGDHRAAAHAGLSMLAASGR